MKKPRERPKIPARSADNNKRRLKKEPTSDDLNFVSSISYVGSPKHKRHPHLYGLPPFNGARGDATLCDEHAGFGPGDMSGIADLITRSSKAGLMGSAVWTVADNGWIFEARLTNFATGEHHGYPVRPSEAIAEEVYRRFRHWADAHGDGDDKQAAENCRNLYGFSK